MTERRRREAKRLVGVIHVPPLPGSPAALRMSQVLTFVKEDAERLAEAGFEDVIVENFGDAPFFADDVPKVTVAAMTACVLAVKETAKSLRVGVNVLRNDAAAALSIAAVANAAYVRINVHTGARVTDQGLVSGRAAETLRLRKLLGAEGVAIWADVAVKHSAPLGVRPLEDEAHDLSTRGMVDAILVTGAGTGKATDVAEVARVKGVVSQPVYVASGASKESLRELLQTADGVIVGTAIKRAGKAGEPVDLARAKAFVTAFQSAV
jgi:membrane complex biogenesis BtpA family protein